MKRPTMREVAKLAGVSVQTVSHVVNQTGNIADHTRERVAELIESLNYRPNPIARSMRTQETGLIGLLVLDITSPVLSTIASEVEAAAYEHQYKVLLYNARHDARLERNSLEAFAEQLVDGLIIVNAMDRDKTLSWLQDSTIPTVLVDCLPSASLPSVAMDNHRGAYLATEHLITLGHERIVHLSGDLSFEVARQRNQGYRQALSDYGLAEYIRTVTPASNRWDYSSGYLAMQEVLAGPALPTAAVVAADQMAIGAYRALTEAGLKVPDDMSVVGFDDIEAAAFATPPLTTICQPLKAMASNAFKLLLELRAKHPEAIDTQITLQPELILRESTRKLT